MGLSVEEIVQLAVSRVKEQIDEKVREVIAPIAREFDEKLEEVRAQGRALVAAQAQAKAAEKRAKPTKVTLEVEENVVKK